MTAILETKASYHGDQDAVQVIVILADSVDGHSLHSSMGTAHCDLVYHNHVVASQLFTPEAYISPGDISNGEIGEFRLCFFHPSLRHELEVIVEVSLTSGEELRVIRQVGRERDPDATVDMTNPLLDSKQPLTYPKLPGVDYARHP